MGPPSYLQSVVDRNVAYLYIHFVEPFLEQCAGTCEKMALKVVT